MIDRVVVEPGSTSNNEFELTRRALELRVRQQEILAELGVLALRGVAFPELSQHATLLVAEGMCAEFCKVMEYLPAENRLIVRSGVGWAEGVVGTATVGADLESPAGFALRTGKPVISNHLGEESRFRTPELLLEHGIHRAANVILQGEKLPYGVLEVDSRTKDKFSEHDIAFLQGAANILGMAIERQRNELELRAASAYQQVLLREVDHRVKNSLQFVISVFRLQIAATSDENVRQQLKEAVSRVSAVGRVHQRLYRTNNVHIVDLGSYLEDLCRDMHEVAAQCEIRVNTAAHIEIPTDNAVAIGTLITELVMNAAKHAYPNRDQGPIWVAMSKTNDGQIEICVRDEGIGLPSGQRPSTTGLGMRIVAAMARQLGAEVTSRSLNPGTEYIVSIPPTARDDAREGPS